jgi:hypothetical protein
LSFLRRRGSRGPGPLVSYRRHGGRPPPDRELLEVSDDGSFSMWRTIARAFDPPAPIGRFAGTLDPGALERLQAAAEDAARAGDLTEELPAGSAVEETAVGKRTATLPHTASPNGPWGELLGQVRPLLVELTGQPRAAVGLRLGEGLQLVHLGAEPLRLGLGQVEVRAILWEGYEQRGTWRWAGALSPDPVDAGPGWMLEVPFEHGLEGAGELVAYVDLMADDGDGWLTCSLQTPRATP